MKKEKIDPYQMEKSIHYQSLVRFTGRNGYFKQKGMLLERGAQTITLVPVTSKGEPGRCSQQIPLDHVPAMISALQQLIQ